MGHILSGSPWGVCSVFLSSPNLPKISLQNSPEILFFCSVFLAYGDKKLALFPSSPSTTQPMSPSHFPGSTFSSILVLFPCLLLPSTHLCLFGVS